MVSTRVGYAGGATRKPTYHDIGDHAEKFVADAPADLGRAPADAPDMPQDMVTALRSLGLL